VRFEPGAFQQPQPQEEAVEPQLPQPPQPPRLPQKNQINRKARISTQVQLD